MQGFYWQYFAKKWILYLFWHNIAIMLLNTPVNPQDLLKRLGMALRYARRRRGEDNSNEFGRAIGVSGRTLRELEASGKGSTENLLRVLMALSPQSLEQLLLALENAEPVYSSVDEALQVPSGDRK